MKKGTVTSANTCSYILCKDAYNYLLFSLFFISLLYLVAEFCGNVELCRLTEQVVFSDPYKVSQYNRCTSPFLDEDAKAVREDNILKLEVGELKSMYLEKTSSFLVSESI